MSPDASTQAQLVELFQFLSHPSPSVVGVALAHLVPHTLLSSSHRDIFLSPPSQSAAVIARLVHISQNEPQSKDKTIIENRQLAIKALVNLADRDPVRLLITECGVEWVMRDILDTLSPFSDLCSMLLANLTVTEKAAKACISSEQDVVRLLDVFSTGGNPQASYDYLANVFSNISTLAEGRKLLTTSNASLPPLASLASFTEHPSPTRRSGVASTIKNCCFATSLHSSLLDENDANILPSILLPLCGSEDFDLEDQEQMPTEIQLLPPNKQRESDPYIRLLHLESLLLLSVTIQGREQLRTKNVYAVIKTMHLTEPSDQVRQAIEKLVNLLMRDESAETKLADVANDDFSIQEV